MVEWKRCDLGELIDDGEADLQTGPFGTMLNASEYVPFGTPVIAVQDIGNNKLTHEKFVYVTPETASRLSRYSVKAGDIIFGRKGAVDRRAIVKPAEEGWLQGSDCIRLRLSTAIDARFVSYQFGSDYYKEWMFQNSGGATMPSLNQTILKHLPLTLPPLAEQKAIAAVLSSLDDKIDLLHRQNKTLEALAETLFRQWFVEEAQEDWAEGSLGEYVEVMRGLSYKGSGLSEAGLGLPMHNLNSVYEGGGYKYEGIKYYCGDYKDRHLVYPGDVIVTNTEQGHEHRLIGCPAIVPDFYGEYGLFSQHVYRLRLLGNQLTVPFLYHLLMSNDMREQVTGATNGSTVNMLPKDGIEWAKFRMPPPSRIKAFTAFAAPCIEKGHKIHRSIRTLEKLRDTLLPKLMSGEVRVGY